MFGNLVNLHDVVAFAEKIHGVRTLAGRLALSSRVRTQAAWRHTKAPASNWWDIPDVRSRWNEKITGSTERSPCDHVLERYFSGRSGLTMLSLGCGTGEKELEWAVRSAVEHIRAVDLSPERISSARAQAATQGLSAKIDFSVSDARKPVPGTFDLILLDGALHHLAPVRRLLAYVRDAIRPGGVLVVNDFVGPSRFQWTDAQLEEVRRFLAVIPENYRRRWQDGREKTRVYRPGRLSMWVSDPSEAAESSLILPALRERFDLLEVKDLGGTILHLLFKDIAHHYTSPDAEARRILAETFRAEDEALRTGRLPSDFVFVVARPAARP
jgi:SAM-dependent methyltransferase